MYARMLADMLSGHPAVDFKEFWERERTARSIRAFAVRVYAPGCSLRETKAILWLELNTLIRQFGSGYLGWLTAFPALRRRSRRCRGWRDRCPNQRRVVIVVRCNISRFKIVARWRFFHRRGTDPAKEFLEQLTGKHNLSNTEFLVDGYEYLIALFRLDLSSYLDYVHRKLIKKWFHTLKMRIDRFDNS